MLKKLFVLLLALCFISSTVFAAKIINLPQPNLKGAVPVESSIYWRRSVRSYKDVNLTLQQISQILWAAQGITDRNYGFRSAPSAGALYPLTLYVVKSDGIFRYLPDGHKLAQISDKDMRPSLVRASLGQSFIQEAPVSIIIAANFSITQAKYGPRAFRYVCMEIGHVAENIHLQAVAMGLGSIPVGAFWDDVVRKSLKLPDNQDPLYIIPIGHVEK
ncbi:MAG: SagB/ThcOx family dehydrogenase [Candidatus Saganbacteria bacterium]|nr:SagB/ThcOx family dehydrogenase [Candidatus Saganbacteria bacterium]